MRDAVGHAELLPMVEDVLRELYEHSTDNQLTFAAYKDLGDSVEGALARRAEKAFIDLPDEVQESFDSVLQALVTHGKESGIQAHTEFNPALVIEDRVARQWAAMSGFVDASPARQLIDAFVAQRLFTTGKHPETGVASVTVAHESLLRVWPRAAEWAGDNGDFLRTRARVAARLKESSPLLEDDPLLGSAKDHLRRASEGFFPQELRDFIENSVRTAEVNRIRRQKRNRALICGGIVAVIAVIASSLYGLYSSYNREQDALAGQFAAEAERDLSRKDYAKAEIAAAKSLTIRDTPSTREMLLTARIGGVSLVSSSARETPNSALSVFSRDGQFAVTVLNDGAGNPATMAIVSSKDGKALWTINSDQFKGLPESMTFSEIAGEQRRLAVSWPDHSIEIWSLDNGKPASLYRQLSMVGSDAGHHSKRVPSLAFHPSKPWIATSSEDRKLCLWDYSQNPARLIWEQEDTHGTAVHGIAFNADGSLLASGGGDYLVKLWKTSEMSEDYDGQSPYRVHAIKPVKKLEGHTDSVFAIAFSPDGERLASAGYDRAIRIWDLTPDNNKLPIATLSGHDGTVLALAFSDDSKLLSSGGKDKTVRLWDVTRGQILVTLTPANGDIRSVASPNFEDDIYSGGENGWSRWSAHGRSVGVRLWNGGATVNAIAFDPGGRYVAAGGDDGRVRIWDQSYKSPAKLDTQQGKPINGIAFSADSRWIAAAGDGGTIHVWDGANNWEKTKPLIGDALKHDGPVWGLCFDPNGRWLASSNADTNIRIRLWKLNDWSLLEQSEKLDDSVYSLACGADGNRIVSGDSKAEVAVWETEPRLTKQDHFINVSKGERNVWSVAITAAPVSILSGNSDGRVRRWIPNGIESAGAKDSPISTSDEDATVNPTINSVSYSQRRGWVAAGGDGGSVEIYDINNLRRLRSLKGHDGTIWYVSFDPQGSRLASGGADRVLRILNLDEVNRNLESGSPDELYQEAQKMTGLSADVSRGRVNIGSHP